MTFSPFLFRADTIPLKGYRNTIAALNCFYLGVLLMLYTP